MDAGLPGEGVVARPRLFRFPREPDPRRGSVAPSLARRTGALLALLILVAAPAGASLASASGAGPGGPGNEVGPSLIRPRHTPGPPPAANRFVGDFDLRDAQDRVVGHLVADFDSPTDAQVQPGSLTIYWHAEAPPVPLAQVLGAPAVESHTLLSEAWFYDEVRPQPAGETIVAGTAGEICDYVAPSGAPRSPGLEWLRAGFRCRPFALEFTMSADPARRHSIAWQFDPHAMYADFGLSVGAGTFDLRYVQPARRRGQQPQPARQRLAQPPILTT